MLRFELLEIDPLDGGVGYGGGYGGSGSLVLNEYIPQRTAAKTGELWMSFLNDPSKKPFKVQDVVAGQKVQVPSVPDAPVRFYLISNDPSGRKTVVNLNAARVRDVNVNKENKTPVIEQIGLSTLDKIQIGIKNYLETARFRKIQISTTSNFAAGTFVDYAIRDFDGIVKVIGAVEIISRTFSESEATRWIRLAHSTNNVNYSPWSNILQIIFKNASGYGVPVLLGDTPETAGTPNAPKIDLLSGEWLVKPVFPVKNTYDIRVLEYRMIHISNVKYLPGAISASATQITLNDYAGTTNLTNLPAAGKIWINGETISYTSIGGESQNVLMGCTRGLEDSLPTAWSAGESVYPIFDQRASGDLFQIKINQNADDFYIETRFRNEEGWSKWSQGARANGVQTIADPNTPPPPPPVDPPPPPEYEDPFNPENDKRRKNDFYVPTI